MLRIGTCGGIGLPPGSVVVTEEALDGRLRPTLDTVQSVNSIQHIHSVPLSLSIVPTSKSEMLAVAIAEQGLRNTMNFITLVIEDFRKMILKVIFTI